MSKQFCPECGHENPGEARFCMDCGHSLTGEPSQRSIQSSASATPSSNGGTDWAGIVAALLAFLSLRHMSRKARQTTIVIAFLVLFFGCPMVCGFVAFVLEWIGRLFQ